MTIKKIWQKAGIHVKLILIIYVLSFLGATYNHITDIAKYGWFPYTGIWGVPESMNIYWTLLTFLDPIAIIVLLFSIKTGLGFYFFVMISDVTVNLLANTFYWKQPFFQSYGLILQISFLIFLTLTAPIVWKYTRTAEKKNDY